MVIAVFICSCFILSASFVDKVFYVLERLFARQIRLQDLKKVLPEDKAQKSEELRLRALELKLKGEELRLKEMEMNKINYLANIEEEKLKCFRDISASLKE